MKHFIRSQKKNLHSIRSVLSVYYMYIYLRRSLGFVTRPLAHYEKLESEKMLFITFFFFSESEDIYFHQSYNSHFSFTSNPFFYSKYLYNQ